MTDIVPYVITGEVVSVDDLVAEVNREHHLVEEGLTQALQHAIICGQLLTDLRNNHVEFKGWEKFVEENFDFRHNTGSYYMRIYEYRDLIQDQPSISKAMRSLAGQPALRRPGYKGYDEEVKETARTMAAQGMSKTEIAKILGVYRQTVVNWLDPEALKRHKERVRKYSAERRAERAKKKKEAAERAAERNAKRVGGALAEAYSLVHKLEAPLAIAAREATDPEVKRLLDDAIYQQHRTLYRIVAALGVS